MQNATSETRIQMKTAHSEVPEPKRRDDMWEVDRMLLRDEITLDEHLVLEEFIHDIHNVRLFSMTPQSFEVRSHTNLPRSGTAREVMAWEKLSRIQERFKTAGPEVNQEMMDAGLDVPKKYDPAIIKKGVRILSEFYDDWSKH